MSLATDSISNAGGVRRPLLLALLACLPAEALASGADVLGPGFQMMALIALAIYCLPLILALGALMIHQHRYRRLHLAVVLLGLGLQILAVMPHRIVSQVLWFPLPDWPIFVGSLLANIVIFISYRFFQPSTRWVPRATRDEP